MVLLLGAHEIVSALIACGGVLVSTMFSLVIGLLTHRHSKHRLYADLVSERRNRWLNDMRDNLSIMMAEARKAGNHYKSKEFYQAQTQLLTRLNLTEVKHAELYTYIRILEGCGADIYDKIEPKIIELATNIFKEEWERVKQESKE